MRHFNFSKTLIVELGLVISQEQLFYLQVCLPYLAINVNIKTGIMSIADTKNGGNSRYVCIVEPQNLDHQKGTTWPVAGRFLTLYS